jgi:hypothetical protein
MTKKEGLYVVKANTTVDDGNYYFFFDYELFCLLILFFREYFFAALEALVEKRITGFPVIDDDWRLVSFSFYLMIPLSYGFFSCLPVPCFYAVLGISWSPKLTLRKKKLRSKLES